MLGWSCWDQVSTGFHELNEEQTSTQNLHESLKHVQPLGLCRLDLLAQTPLYQEITLCDLGGVLIFPSPTRGG